MTGVYQVTEPVELEYNGLPLVVCFTNSLTCAPCRLFKPHFEKAADELSDIAGFAVVEVLDNMEIAQQYGVSSTPTVLFIGKNGAVNVAARAYLPLVEEIRELVSHNNS